MKPQPQRACFRPLRRPDRDSVIFAGKVQLEEGPVEWQQE
ncbi:Hypothetical protein Cul131001_0175 [Corynebacterium ulcerans]|nr:Hypothetical protein Cul131001_0175 [Corynebacterium ulcerans]